jgi:trans-aconitate 2-methyltransferase
VPPSALWDPTQYEAFRGPRTRPALDLIAALPDLAPRRIVDLGCGTGRIARLLADRHPEASVQGVDSSAAMLAEAAAEGPSRIEWQQGDIATWAPAQPVDLLFSNAALHWVPDHAALFRRLLACIAPGGVLAVQMPRNFAQPSHAVMREVAAQGPWAARLADAFQANAHPPAFYYDCLAGQAAVLDIWETDYLQVLTGANPVLEWTKGTALLPVMERLGEAERPEFVQRYGERLLTHYPKQPDGKTLFPFRRIFVVARASVA